MIVVGVLMSGNTVSVGGSSPHVYHAIDSTMGPKMDLSIPSFTVTSSAGASYVRGDIVTLDATVANSGDLDYNSGGSVDFFYVLNGNKNYIGQGTTINTLTTSGASRTMTAQTTFDTSALPSNGWKTVFGVELSTSGESITSNNQATTDLDHDRPPKSKTPQVIGTSEISRGQYFSVLAKGDADDNVDSIDTLTFDVEISELERVNGQGMSSRVETTSSILAQQMKAESTLFFQHWICLPVLTTYVRGPLMLVDRPLGGRWRMRFLTS